MTPDYKALCAELLAVFDSYDDESNLVGIFDDMKANKNDLLDRARAALAEPEPPADGEVADPVISGEYRGFNAIAYRNGFHAGHKHALSRAALAPQPVLEGPTAEGEMIGPVIFLKRHSNALKRPSDEELTLTYAYAVAAAVDNKQGPFKEEDVKAAQLAGLRTVLARWGHAPNA